MSTLWSWKRYVLRGIKIKKPVSESRVLARMDLWFIFQCRHYLYLWFWLKRQIRCRRNRLYLQLCIHQFKKLLLLHLYSPRKNSYKSWKSRKFLCIPKRWTFSLQILHWFEPIQRQRNLPCSLWLHILLRCSLPRKSSIHQIWFIKSKCFLCNRRK